MSDTPAPRERLHALDAVRGIALLLGVVLHATMSFLPGPQLWITVDASRSPLLSAVFYGLHTFRMLTFFLLAGFFARLSFHRLGLKGFVLDRLKRIALPLLIFWPLVFAALIAILLWNARLIYGDNLPASSSPPLSAQNFPLLHLWFLYLLLILYAAWLTLRSLLLRVPGLARAADIVVRAIMGWGGVSLLALPMTLGLFFHRDWLGWFGVPTPDQSLYPNLAALVAYGTAFGFGWLLQRQPGLLRPLERRWVWYAVAAGLIVGWNLWRLGVTPALQPMPQDANTFLYAALYSLGSWCAVFALIGLAVRFLNRERPLQRYVADASYWVYIAHLPLVMALQTLVSTLELSWALKFPLILLVAFALLFLSYHLLVRNTALGRLLGGRRPKRELPATPLSSRPAR